MVRSSRLTTRVLIAAGLIGASALAAHADVVIGNWEGGSDDGWIDWSSGKSITDASNTSVYSFATTGATVGTSSLEVNKSGWAQTLSIKLEGKTDSHGNSLVSDFMSNNTLLMDLTLPATTASGWSQFYQVIVNAQGWGFKPITASPAANAQWGWGSTGGGQQTYTLAFDYTAALAAIPANPSYVEIIINTNNDGTHTQYYFDNVRLATTPEPASLSVLAIASSAWLLRRSCRA